MNGPRDYHTKWSKSDRERDMSFDITCMRNWGFPNGSAGKESTCNAGDTKDMGSILGWKDSLEEGMATLSSILTWRIPWTEEPGGLQSTRLQKVEHD